MAEEEEPAIYVLFKLDSNLVSLLPWPHPSWCDWIGPTEHCGGCVGTSNLKPASGRGHPESEGQTGKEPCE